MPLRDIHSVSGAHQFVLFVNEGTFPLDVIGSTSYMGNVGLDSLAP